MMCGGVCGGRLAWRALRDRRCGGGAVGHVGVSGGTPEGGRRAGGGGAGRRWPRRRPGCGPDGGQLQREDRGSGGGVRGVGGSLRHRGGLRRHCGGWAGPRVDGCRAPVPGRRQGTAGRCGRVSWGARDNGGGGDRGGRGGKAGAVRREDAGGGGSGRRRRRGCGGGDTAVQGGGEAAALERGGAVQAAVGGPVAPRSMIGHGIHAAAHNTATLLPGMQNEAQCARSTEGRRAGGRALMCGGVA